MLPKSLVIGAVLLVMLSAMPAGAGLGDPPEANLIVGFEGRQVDSLLLQSLGATVTGKSDNLGIAAVYSPNPAGLAGLLALQPSIAWVETNDATFAESSQWDSSQWDSSQWDSSQWDASGWDSSQWDSSQWDASGWDSSQWDSSQWDSSQWDSSQWDSSQWDASGWDSSQWDSSQWDSSQWDSSQWDASGWDASGWDQRGFSASQMTSLGRAAGPSGTDPLVRWQWGIAATALPRAATLGLATQAICIVDSGVDHAHPEFAGRYLGGYDFVNRDSNAMDDAGHGTHVAGIAAAASGNGKGIAGTAPAKILAAKVLGSDGSGTEFDLALGIDWCTRNGADVISMSLGTPERSQAVHRAIVDAHAAGIVQVASAGNTGASCDCVRYPAAYPQVISVGAVMPNSGRAPFSAVSQGIDLVAPGYAIVSTLPGNAYGSASGTSQATPFVSGAAALLLAQGATGQQASAALRDTALDLGPAGHDPAFGYGSLDIGAALASVG